MNKGRKKQLATLRCDFTVIVQYLSKLYPPHHRLGKQTVITIETHACNRINPAIVLLTNKDV